MTTKDEILTAASLLADQKIQREHFVKKLRMLDDEVMAPAYTSMVDGGITWVPASKGKDAMTTERWQRIKQLRPHATLMFKSCQPNKHTSARATYRKVEHGGTS